MNRRANPPIVPRNQRIGRDSTPARWWLNDDPVATAFYNALSITFPRGEAFFVDSVRNFRDGTPPDLASEINAFIKQEVVHSREHVAFNSRAEASGYTMVHLEQDVIDRLELSKKLPPIARLGLTMAMEHYTALIAHELLANPRHLAGAEAATADLWRWHALEEIEHKGVAYDTWRHATRDWSRGRRWRIKALLMIVISVNFIAGRTAGMLDLLRQDGITGPRAWGRLFWYVFGTPGMMRRIIPGWLAYFGPGFHPWNHDDRALIALNESRFADAVLPAAA